MSSRDDGPVYYREIQKNAYLKRIPNEDGGSKLRPLGQKKPALKPMWTLLCVHNGRIPYLEQYPAAESPSTASHTPAWRASLRTARHVTASVRPRVGTEYDFLIDTDHGPLRMLAPDWDSMQDWVHTLRAKLHELKILAGGENVYCRAPAAPAPAPPRAPQRDPTSPLPPTPPLPPTRIPGIEITPRPTIQETQPQPQIQQTETEIESQTIIQTTQEQRNQDRNQRIENPIRNQRTEENIQRTDENETVNEISNNNTQEPQVNEANEPIDISNWEPFDQPSTSQEKVEPKKGVTKICGQNICLDDSILKRNVESTESDEEFFAEIDRIHDSVENLTFDDGKEFKQRLVVNDREKEESSSGTDNRESSPQSTNITVIQVSNKPPHTAIPVMGPETNVFDFDFKRNLSVQNDNQTDSKKFVNIVNTEIQVQNTTDDSYGTVFEESPYGHLSLTTTVNLTGEKCDVDEKERIYERLCLASTSNETPSPFPVRKVRNLDKNRKSSLPNLDNIANSESPYEYLFPNFSQNTNNNVTLNHNNSSTEVNSNSNLNNRDNKRNIAINKVNNEVTISDNSRSITTTDISRNNVSTSENTRTHNTSENIQSNNTSIINNSRSNVLATNNTRSNDTTCNNSRTNITTTEISRSSNETQNLRQNQNLHVNLTNSISVGNTDPTARVIRANVERSHSQNAYDSSPRIRDQLIRRVQRKSPKRDGKNDKTETQTKPIWKRGLTELSLLSRLRGIGQGKRQESPNRQENDNDRVVQSSVKVIHRSRPEGRVDYTRRRSSSLSNAAPGAGTPGSGVPGAVAPSAGSAGPLLSLRARQAAALRAEQRRAAIAARVARHAPPAFLDYDSAVWIWWWGGARCGGRAGDRVVALRGIQPRDASHARQLVKTAPGPSVDILFHRVPLAKIFVFNKRDLETIGIKLDNECNITHVDNQSPASRAGIPPPGAWAVTEVNNRPINLLKVKGGEEEMNRLSLHGTEVSILLQPSPLVKKLRAAMKANKSLLSLK